MMAKSIEADRPYLGPPGTITLRRISEPLPHFGPGETQGDGARCDEQRLESGTRSPNQVQESASQCHECASRFGLVNAERDQQNGRPAREFCEDVAGIQCGRQCDEKRDEKGDRIEVGIYRMRASA